MYSVPWISTSAITRVGANIRRASAARSHCSAARGGSRAAPMIPGEVSRRDPSGALRGELVALLGGRLAVTNGGRRKGSNQAELSDDRAESLALN